VTTVALIANLNESDVSLAVIAPDRLRVEAPRGVVTPEVRATLAQHKAEIIAELCEREEDARRRAFFRELGRDPDAWREFEAQLDERAGVLQFDAGLSREEAETQAEIITYEDWLN